MHSITPSQACESLYASGHSLLEQGRVDDASVLFRTMLLADAADERGWLALGACHERMQQVVMAEELYSAGAQIARNKTRCLLAAARIFARQDDPRACEARDQAERFAVTDDERELIEAERSFQ
jgi:cytochrome c-type biogenesis protein CcmH/NrfG